MSVKTNLKLAKLWLDRQEYARLSKVVHLFSRFAHSNSFQLLRDLYASTTGADNDDQSQKGTQLLEIYALEIQMYNETRNFKKLKVWRYDCQFIGI